MGMASRIKKLRRDGQLHGDAMFVLRPPESRFDASVSVYADVKNELERADIADVSGYRYLT
jgi:hypothetical protein